MYPFPEKPASARAFLEPEAIHSVGSDDSSPGGPDIPGFNLPLSRIRGIGSNAG